MKNVGTMQEDEFQLEREEGSCLFQVGRKFVPQII